MFAKAMLITTNLTSILTIGKKNLLFAFLFVAYFLSFLSVGTK